MNRAECWTLVTQLDASGDIRGAASLCATDVCSGVANCQRYLGWFYFEQGDLALSYNWYAKAALQGDETAREECWNVVLNLDARGNPTKALELCMLPPCAELIEGQRYIAKAFFAQGDMEKTLHWCLKVAERGGADDLAYVGILYRSRNEPELAMDFFKRAIAAGSARANHLIGDVYAFGMGVPKDARLAMPYYEKSADQGFVYGKTRLLHLQRLEGGVLAKLAFLFKLPTLLVWASVIRLRNSEDRRLVDIPKGDAMKSCLKESG